MSTIPAELREQRQWIKLPAGKKYTQETGWQNNPLRWDDIPATNGRGFLLKGSPYLVIDGDHVIKDGQYVNQWAKDFFEGLSATYRELSISGTGVHVFLRLDTPTTGEMERLRHMEANGGRSFNYYPEGEGKDRPHVEIFFNAVRQICMTGKRMGTASTIQPAPAKVNDLLKKMPAFNVPQGQPAGMVAREKELPPDYDLQRAEAMLAYIDPSIDYADWIKVGQVLHDLGADVSMWDSWSMTSSKYRGSREIQSKWNSFKRGSGVGIATLHTMAKAGGYSEKDFLRQWHEKNPTAPIIHHIEPANPWGDTFAGFTEAVTSGTYIPFPIGIKALDDLLGGGLCNSELLTLGAPPAQGKTALCQQIAGSIAKQGRRVLYFCFEMTAHQLTARGIAQECRKELSARDILKGKAGWKEQAEWYRQTMGDRLAYTCCMPQLADVKRIMQEGADYCKARGEQPPIIVIDYVQLLRDGDKEEQESIKSAMEYLKDYARRENTVVIAVVANNRESNKSGKVSMFAGRGSSALEYGADTCLAMAYTEDLLGEEVKNRALRSVKLTKGRFMSDDNRKDFSFVGRYTYFEPMLGKLASKKESKANDEICQLDRQACLSM